MWRSLKPCRFVIIFVRRWIFSVRGKNSTLSGLEIWFGI